jgi:hypothetical protein
MNNARKWMASLSDEQYDWVKQTSEDVGIEGSAIIRECIDKCRKENPRQFTDSLISAKAKIQLDDLLDKKATLEEEIKLLRIRSNGTKVAA